MYHYFEVLVSYTLYCNHPRLLSIQYRPSDFDNEINLRFEADFEEDDTTTENPIFFVF